MEKFETTNTPETISSTIFGSAAILQTIDVKYELKWTLTSLRPSHRRVSTCRLQNGQGQAGSLSGLARGTKALLWRAMRIPVST
jgi:hypothetical protein